MIPMPDRRQGFRHFSYSDVIEGNVDTSYLKDKVIFVGASATGLGDVLATPVGRMPGVELNAWLYLALENEEMIREPTRLSQTVFSSVLLLTIVFILGRLSPKLFLLVSTLSIFCITGLSSLLLLFERIWLPPSATLLGIILFFPLWSWIRAENTLSYLKNELALIGRKSNSIPSKGTLESNSTEFLTRLGFIDTQTQEQTELGSQVAQTLFSSQSTQPIQFWLNKVKTATESAITNDNHYQGIELVSRTISQLNQAREMDQQSRKLIEQSLSALQDAVVITDISGVFKYANHRFNTWFIDAFKSANPRISPALFDVLDILELKSGNSWNQALKSLFCSGGLFSDECIFKHGVLHEDHLEQQSFMVQVSLALTGNEYKDTLIFTFTDITKLKAVERSKAEALNFLSHNLRSPMVSVLSILEKHKTYGASLCDDDIKNIELLVRKNLEYAESFLQLSKAKALNENDLDLCDMHSILDTAHAHALALASSKFISVVVNQCDEDCWVNAEFSLLERAIINLVSNAIKYSPSHSAVKLVLQNRNTVASISVIDEGPGIAEKDQKHLFDRFVRGSGQRNSHGAGLGLNFVATVANKLNGQIQVESELGNGSTFRIELPAYSEEELNQLANDR